MNITKSIKNKAINGIIKETEALAVANKADDLLARSVTVMRKLEKQVGLDTGQELRELVSEITGTAFNAREYLYNKEPEGQES